MQNKPKIIVQAILLFAMAALFAVVPILSLQQEEITDLTTITATEIDNYIKKPVEMDSGDYKILSGSSMWERHQAAGEEPSGDYVTAFYRPRQNQHRRGCCKSRRHGSLYRAS